MATAPKCKVCGAAHWSGQPHAGMAAERAAPKAAVAIRPAAVDDRDAVIAALRAEVAELRADALVTAKRREANRERMKLSRSK